MLSLHSAAVARKAANLQPSNSSESAQTGGSPSPFFGEGSSVNPSANLADRRAGSSLAHACNADARGRVDPTAGIQSIKEALAPLSAAQLAVVQEQLRQSRLARQQESWVGCAEGFGANVALSAPPCSPSPAPCMPAEQAEGGGVNPLVQQVAAALAHGKVSQQDVSRVLSTLDPSVFLPAPRKQPAQQHRAPPQQLAAPARPQPQPQQQLPQRLSGPRHPPTSMLSVPAAMAMPPSPFCSIQGPPMLHPCRPAARHRTRSVATPYSAVLNSLQLPPAALAAHAAAATAADAASQQQQLLRQQGHPGSSQHKGRRSCRRARGQLGSLLRSVSTTSDAAGATSLMATADDEMRPQHGAPCAFQQQAAGDLLYLFTTAQPAAAGSPATAAPATQGEAPDTAMLLCNEAPAGECAEAPAAAVAECAEVPTMAETSLAARFARLPAAVQDDILRQLDELSALEEEARGMQEPEQQGPRRSGRARKVRNWDEAVQSLAFKGAPRSLSPTPPPADDATQQGRPGPKRMRLHAAPSIGQHSPGAASPEAASSARHQHQGGSSLQEAEAPPALDMWVCPEPAEPVMEEQAPRRRRVPRKAGPRASARKRMHRGTFKRGKPQRAPPA